MIRILIVGLRVGLIYLRLGSCKCNPNKLSYHYSIPLVHILSPPHLKLLNFFFSFFFSTKLLSHQFLTDEETTNNKTGATKPPILTPSLILSRCFAHIRKVFAFLFLFIVFLVILFVFFVH